MNPERNLRVFCCLESGLRFEDVYSELRPAKPLRFPFCDLISFGFADDVIDDNGAKHDARGRFSGTTSGGASKAEFRRKEGSHAQLSTGEARAVCQKLRRITEKGALESWRNALEKTRNPRAVLYEAALSVRAGFPVLKRRLPDMETCPIEVGRDFVQESGKYTRGSNKSEEGIKRQMKAARRQLFAYSKAEDVIENGETASEWVHQENHHQNQEFLTLYKAYKVGDEKIVVTVDLKRNLLPNPDRSVKAHNISRSKNPGFNYKMRKLGLKEENIKVKNGRNLLPAVRRNYLPIERREYLPIKRREYLPVTLEAVSFRCEK